MTPLSFSVQPDSSPASFLLSILFIEKLLLEMLITKSALSVIRILLSAFEIMTDYSAGTRSEQFRTRTGVSLILHDDLRVASSGPVFRHNDLLIDLFLQVGDMRDDANEAVALA